MSGRKIFACLVGIALVFATPLEAQTKKKKTTRRTSTSTAAKKKKPPAESSIPAVPLPEPSASPSPSPSEEKASPSPRGTPAANASLSSEQIVEFEKQPAKVRKLLESALALTRQNLSYQYGSADPASGGMDCSGCIYYLLRQNDLTDVPRQSNEQYVWLRKAGTFRAVISEQSETFELDELQPGDLLFWTGTYDVKRDPPITHTMIYLGREKGRKQRVMIGSSDGRVYDGVRRFGVSVFDFKVETRAGTAGKPQPRFVGYARVLGLRE